jgi:hypothetical protein
MLLETVPKSGQLVDAMYNGSSILSFLYIRSTERCWAVGQIEAALNRFQEIGNGRQDVLLKVFNKRFSTHPTVHALVNRANVCFLRSFGRLMEHAAFFGRTPLIEYKVEAGETGIMLYFWLSNGLYMQFIPALCLDTFMVHCEMMVNEIENVIFFNNFDKNKKK